MNRNLVILTIAIVILGAGAVFYALGTRQVATLARGAVDIGAGQALYAGNCASCHGASLEGQPDWRQVGADGIFPAPPHDETGHTWHHGDALLFKYVKQGGQAVIESTGESNASSGMPAFGETLTDAQIRNILAFIRSTWPDRVREVQKKRTDAEKLAGN